jgi:hypothetical protein
LTPRLAASLRSSALCSASTSMVVRMFVKLNMPACACPQDP